MSCRTRASSGFVEEYFDRIISNCDMVFTTVSQAFGTTGRVRLSPIHVRKRVTIDMLGYVIGDAANGNVRIGLYRRGIIGWPDLPDTGALVVETGSLAQPGTNRVHWATVPDTQLAPGLYYPAVQCDDVNGTFHWFSRTQSWHHNILGNVLIGHYYDHPYGAFTNPCPATIQSSYAPVFLLRVMSVP